MTFAILALINYGENNKPQLFIAGGAVWMDMHAYCLNSMERDTEVTFSIFKQSSH